MTMVQVQIVRATGVASTKDALRMKKDVRDVEMNRGRLDIGASHANLKGLQRQLVVLLLYLLSTLPPLANLLRYIACALRRSAADQTLERLHRRGSPHRVPQLCEE